MQILEPFPNSTTKLTIVYQSLYLIEILNWYSYLLQELAKKDWLDLVCVESLDYLIFTNGVSSALIT